MHTISLLGVPYFNKSGVLEIRAELRTPYFNRALSKHDPVTEKALPVQVFELI